MIGLEDGRTRLYQWDIGQRLLITDYPVGTQVHFSNARQIRDGTLTAETYEENGKTYADIDNSLLQSSGNLRVYIYPKKEDEAHTDRECVIRIVPREKPSGYVHTETEVKRWESLEERVAQLEKETGSSDASDEGNGGTSSTQTATEAEVEEMLNEVFPS